MILKAEDDGQYPAEAYLLIGDKRKPETWKLRIWESPEKKTTRKQLDRITDLFGLSLVPGDYQLSEEEFAKAARLLRTEDQRLGEGNAKKK